jgi:hypothetical protein
VVSTNVVDCFGRVSVPRFDKKLSDAFLLQEDASACGFGALSRGQDDCGASFTADVRALQARVLSQLLKGAALGECGTKLKTLSCLQLLPTTPTHAEESLPELVCNRKRSGRRQRTKRKSLSGGAPENTWP